MYPYSVKIPHPAQAESLEQAGICPLVAAILAARQVSSQEKAREILYPDKRLSHDPFALKSMDKAVPRIEKALETGEFMAVYGDYDVDGITSTGLLTHFLQSRGGNVLPYIPQRLAEGYGLNEIALEELFRKGVRLVITVDCGISGGQQVEFASALGMDIIITDHHSCPKELPPAYAILNPRMGDYPFPDLAGVGVALKLAQALSPPEQQEEIFLRYSDLVAVGTVADVMPMEGENRYFVREGLEKLNASPHLGIAFLLEEIGILGNNAKPDRKINTGTIGYNLAPRINAAGRLDRSEVALELLLNQEEDKARQLAQELCTLNQERQEIEGEIFQQCLAQLEESPPQELIFLKNDQWHVGVVGIVASRLGERYHMPTVMVCCREGIGKGSCRTFGDINLYELLTKVSHLLLGFGGHAQAAGFTVAQENLTALEEALRGELEQRLPPRLPPQNILDYRCSIQDLTLESLEQLNLLEPTGANCPRPSFLLESAEVIGASLVGGGRHLRLRLRKDAAEISGIYFHYVGEPVYIGVLMDIAFHLQINQYRGEVSPQLQIFSMTLAEEADSLYQRWKRGATFSYEEARQILPTEGEVKQLYDTLPQEPWVQEGKSYSQLWQGMEEMAWLPPQHGEPAVAILRELSLLNLMVEKNTLSVGKNQEKEDWDLGESQLYQQLKKAVEGKPKRE